MNIPLRVGQYALLSNSKNEILALKRSKSEKWSLPGGRLEPEERDWLLALKREVKEEANIEIDNAEPFAINIAEDLPHQIKYCVYFRVKLKEDMPVQLTEEHSSFLWLNKDSCETVEFEYDFVQKLVRDYLKD